MQGNELVDDVVGYTARELFILAYDVNPTQSMTTSSTFYRDVRHAIFILPRALLQDHYHGKSIQGT